MSNVFLSRGAYIITPRSISYASAVSILCCSTHFVKEKCVILNPTLQKFNVDTTVFDSNSFCLNIDMHPTMIEEESKEIHTENVEDKISTPKPISEMIIYWIKKKCDVATNRNCFSQLELQVITVFNQIK